MAVLTAHERRQLMAIVTRILLSMQSREKRTAAARYMADELNGWIAGRTITAPLDSSGTTPPKDSSPI